MKVKELIKELKKFPQEYEVKIEGCTQCVNPAGSVEVYKEEVWINIDWDKI